MDSQAKAFLTPTEQRSSNIERRDHRKADRKRLYLSWDRMFIMSAFNL
jgi:hypothetical protein